MTGTLIVIGASRGNGAAPGDRGAGATRADEFRGRAPTAEQERRLEILLCSQPDATLAELQRALPTTAALAARRPRPAMVRTKPANANETS